MFNMAACWGGLQCTMPIRTPWSCHGVSTFNFSRFLAHVEKMFHFCEDKKLKAIQYYPQWKMLVVHVSTPPKILSDFMLVLGGHFLQHRILPHMSPAWQVVWVDQDELVTAAWRGTMQRNPEFSRCSSHDKTKSSNCSQFWQLLIRWPFGLAKSYLMMRIENYNHQAW